MDGGPIHSVWLARSLDQGGSQLRMAETVEHLARRGWTTTVLSPAEGPLRPRLEAAGAEVRLVEAVPFDDVTRYRAAVSRLVGELEGADLAVAPTVTSFPLVHAAALAGVPAVQRIGEEAPLPTVAAWLVGSLDAEIEAYARRAITGAAAIWTNAHAVEASYRAQGYDGAWSVVHTGRPAIGDQPSRTEARRLLGLRTDRRLVVCAGTIWPVKGQGLLTEAARIVRHDHPELLVALVGYDGNPYAAQLRAHVAAHDLTDTVLLAPFHDDLGTWWAAADAVALTPHAPSEALSGALVEGMTHGLPALATRAGDSAVMVQDGHSGWLCDADDLGSLVDALRRLASADDATMRAYGVQAAARCAQEDDREGALARAAALLEECASPVRSAASWAQVSGAASTFLVNFSVAGAQSSVLSGMPWLDDFTATAKLIGATSPTRAGNSRILDDDPAIESRAMSLLEMSLPSLVNDFALCTVNSENESPPRCRSGTLSPSKSNHTSIESPGLTLRACLTSTTAGRVLLGALRIVTRVMS